MSTLPIIRDVTEATFREQVIERSKTVPILVDFWAPWCGPCRTLGPLLEKEIEALGGRVELCKLNTDQDPNLASQFGIRGIPAVKAFRDGQMVDEFTGVIPVPAIREFLARLAPTVGVGSLEGALAALSAGAIDEGIAILRTLTDTGDTAEAAAFHLAHALFAQAKSREEIRPLLARVKPQHELFPRVDALLRLADLADRSPELDVASALARVEATPRDHDARLDLAAAYLRSASVVDALDALLESVSRSATINDAAARKHMVAIFDHLDMPGRNPELSREYRRKLQIVL
ncbi:MAG: tetratricopeptide repeat protein [Deltaproteobacteria bacterium]|nr:tetratricopeptide repeat protein [Deltaproteobacteria bacterium]